MILLFLVEAKMEHPFKPVLAFKNFRNKIYEDRFVFKAKLNFNEQILEEANVLKNVISKSTFSITENLSNHTVHLSENGELLKENNRLHKKNDYDFEIRPLKGMTFSEVLSTFQISKESEKSLVIFLSGRAIEKKIHFTTKPKKGVRIKEIIEFFQNHTNLIEKNSSSTVGKKYIVDIINELVISTDMKGESAENPLNPKNISDYI